MGDFTKIGDVQPENLPAGAGEWRGLYIGQMWVKRTAVKRPFPLGRVHISDLVKMPSGEQRVHFWNPEGEPGKDRAVLPIEAFLKEYVRG